MPDAPPPDAQDLDATVASASCTRTLALAFGRLEAPTGWCWRRTREGDDLSGELRDERDRVRVRYDLLAFGERVPDPCRARAKPRRTRREAIRRVPFESCELADGTTCVSFDGRVNLCAKASEADGFSPIDLARTLVPAKP